MTVSVKDSYGEPITITTVETASRYSAKTPIEEPSYFIVVMDLSDSLAQVNMEPDVDRQIDEKTESTYGLGRQGNASNIAADAGRVTGTNTPPGVEAFEPTDVQKYRKSGDADETHVVYKRVPFLDFETRHMIKPASAEEFRRLLNEICQGRNIGIALQGYSIHQLNIETSKVVGQIGKGAYGMVFKLRSQSGYIFACKRTPIEKFRRQEPWAMYDSNGGYAPELYGVIHSKRYVYLLMEFLPKTLDKENADVKTKVWLKTLLFRMLLSMVQYQKKNIVHCDIKPYHIAYKDNQIKFLDWGSVWYMQEQWSRSGMTLAFLSPEVCGQDYPYRADEYAAAVSVLQAAVGKLYCSHSELISPKKWKTSTDIANGDKHAEVLSLVVEALKKDKISPSMADLLNAMLAVDPNDRITAEAAIRRSLFNDLWAELQQTNSSLPNETSIASVTSGYYSVDLIGNTGVSLIGPGHTTMHKVVPKSILLGDFLAKLRQHYDELQHVHFYELIRGNKFKISPERMQQPIADTEYILWEKNYVEKETTKSRPADPQNHTDDISGKRVPLRPNSPKANMLSKVEQESKSIIVNPPWAPNSSSSGSNGDSKEEKQSVNQFYKHSVSDSVIAMGGLTLKPNKTQAGNPSFTQKLSVVKVEPRWAPQVSIQPTQHAIPSTVMTDWNPNVKDNPDVSGSTSQTTNNRHSGVETLSLGQDVPEPVLLASLDTEKDCNS